MHAVTFFVEDSLSCSFVHAVTFFAEQERQFFVFVCLCVHAVALNKKCLSFSFVHAVAFFFEKQIGAFVCARSVCISRPLDPL